MNKTIKLKQLVSIMPASSRIKICECDWNGDTITHTGIIYVGDPNKYSTYMEKHIKFIEVQANITRIFL